MTTRNEPCAITAEKLIRTRKNRPNVATQFGRRFRELGFFNYIFLEPWSSITDDGATLWLRSDRSRGDRRAMQML